MNEIEGLENVLKEKPEEKESVFNFLRNRGYDVSEWDKIGEGHTRNVYLAKYNSGGINQRRVVKIPKDNIDPSSLCTIINLSKGDVNQKEIETSNLTSFRHDNIISVLDSFNYKGKIITAEEYVGGQSVEDLAAINPLNTEAVVKIFVQVCKGVDYLHKNRILHRDIKPSNIIAEQDKIEGITRVKITDLQNAAKISDINSASLPTRGGTSYTYPELLNAIVGGNEARASMKTDIYAIGASIFESVTGERVFNYKLELDYEGTEVLIGKEKYKVALKEGDKKISRIDPQEHEAKLKKRINLLPSKLRKPVYRALTMDDKKQYWGVGGLENDLLHTGEPWLKKAGEKVLRSIKPVLVGAVSAAVLGGIIWSLATRDPEYKPTMKDILQKEDCRNFNLDLSFSGAEGNYQKDILYPYFLKVKEELPGILDSITSKSIFGKENTLEEHIDFLTNNMVNIQAVDKRLASSWLKAVYLLDKKDFEKTYCGSEECDRLYPSCAPKEFAIKNTAPYDLPVHDEDLPSLYYGTQWLKRSVIRAGDVADIFANYFCDDNEVGTAIIRTESLRYLPRYGKDGGLEVGYSQYLPDKKCDLINTALAIYYLTDDQGNTDFSKIPKLDFPKGKYSQYLHLPPK